jgi:hypothetical protein
MSPKKTTDDVVTVKLHRTIVRSLPVRLTDEELLKKGSDLATAVQDIATEEGRQVDIKASMKAKLAEIEARRTQLAIAVSRKEEHRDVEVDIFHDYQRAVVQDIRRDTGEVLSTRVMSEEERQIGLPMEPATV